MIIRIVQSVILENKNMQVMTQHTIKVGPSLHAPIAFKQGETLVLERMLEEVGAMEEVSFVDNVATNVKLLQSRVIPIDFNSEIKDLIRRESISALVDIYSEYYAPGDTSPSSSLAEVLPALVEVDSEEKPYSVFAYAEPESAPNQNSYGKVIFLHDPVTIASEVADLFRRSTDSSVMALQDIILNLL